MLETAPASDRANGMLPCVVVATTGTTSTAAPSPRYAAPSVTSRAPAGAASSSLPPSPKVIDFGVAGSTLTSHIAHELVHTGQHYDANMSAAFLADLRLPEPDFHLGIGSGSHAEQTGRVMVAYGEVARAVNNA